MSFSRSTLFFLQGFTQSDTQPIRDDASLYLRLDDLKLDNTLTEGDFLETICKPYKLRKKDDSTTKYHFYDVTIKFREEDNRPRIKLSDDIVATVARGLQQQLGEWAHATVEVSF